MLTKSALALIQESVEDCPALMLEGDAVQLDSCGPVKPVTTTVADEVSSLTLLRAVKV